jgi:isopentenyldiphosphate isomerase
MVVNEYFEIFSEYGQKTGRLVERSRVHSEGLWHRSVHVWIFNRNSEILFQKRAPMKDSHPGLWDVSAAGHIDPGELPVQSALREINEELGLSVSEEKLCFIDRRKITLISQEGSFIDREFTFIYIHEWNGDPESLTLQKKEVEKIQFFHIDHLKELLNNVAERRAFVPHGEDYYSKIVNIVATRAGEADQLSNN